MPRRRSWTDDDLRTAVAASRSLNDVFRRLELRVGGASWVDMQRHIVRLDLSTDHWDRGTVRPGRSADRTRSTRPRVPAWDDDAVLAAFSGARSVAEVLRRLGADPGRRAARRRVVERLLALGHDPSSLPGQAWAGGRLRPRPARPLHEVLVSDSPVTSTTRLKARLIAAGLLEPRCAGCGITEWRARPCPLELDHINGERRDNRLVNLRLLCPNCHAQTETHAGRNIR